MKVRIAMSNIENLMNQTVQHKKYGNGCVIKIEGNHLTVSFSVKECIFCYPEVFEQYLTIEGNEINSLIAEDIIFWKNTEEYQRHEANKKAYMETQAGIQRRKQIQEEKALLQAQRRTGRQFAQNVWKKNTEQKN